MPFSDAYHLVSSEFLSNITVFIPSPKTILVFLNWKFLLLVYSLHFHKLMLPHVLDKILLGVEKFTKKTNHIIPCAFKQGNAIELFLSNTRLYSNKQPIPKGESCLSYRIEVSQPEDSAWPGQVPTYQGLDWVYAFFFINQLWCEGQVTRKTRRWILCYQMWANIVNLIKIQLNDFHSSSLFCFLFFSYTN